jgi:hypothetical protein
VCVCVCVQPNTHIRQNSTAHLSTITRSIMINTLSRNDEDYCQDETCHVKAQQSNSEVGQHNTDSLSYFSTSFDSSSG